MDKQWTHKVVKIARGMQGEWFDLEEKLMHALESGETTIESIAEATGWPVINGCLIPEPDIWHADDGNAEITGEFESGQEAAQDYVDTGEWNMDEESESCWITVWAWREGIDIDGDIVQVDRDSYTIRVDPDEPECSDGEDHDWQSPLEIVGGIKENPGVWGHGGGVVIQEVCMRCGCGKLIDTWAQDPQNGRQGLTSVSYEPGKYTNEISRADNE